MKPISTTLAALALMACSCGGQSGAGNAADASIDVARSLDGSPARVDAGEDGPAPSVDAGEDGPGPSVDSGEEAPAPVVDSGVDSDGDDSDAGPLDCTYGDGGSVFDAGGLLQGGGCGAGCPAGTVCAIEIGGAMSGEPGYCAPIPDRCKNDVTCACLGSCVCGLSYGRAQLCADQKNDAGVWLACDNGVR